MQSQHNKLNVWDTLVLCLFWWFGSCFDFLLVDRYSRRSTWERVYYVHGQYHILSWTHGRIESIVDDYLRNFELFVARIKLIVWSLFTVKYSIVAFAFYSQCDRHSYTSLGKSHTCALSHGVCCGGAADAEVCCAAHAHSRTRLHTRSQTHAATGIYLQNCL